MNATDTKTTEPVAAASGTPLHFRWETVPASFRDWLRGKTEDIVGLTYKQACDAVRIGVALNEVKQKLKHGTFNRWVTDELPFSLATAHRYRQIATAFAAFATSQFEMFDESALYVLAQLKVPVQARELAVERVKAGQYVSHADALQILDAFRDPPDEPPDEEEETRPMQCLGIVPPRSRMAEPRVCGVTFMGTSRHRFCPKCERRLTRQPISGQVNPKEAVRRCDKIQRLAAECTMIRIEKLVDTDHPNDAYSVTVYRENKVPHNVVRDDLFQAIALLAKDELGVEDQKCCRRCGEYKPVSAFRRNQNNADALDRWCRSCKKADKQRAKQARREQLKGTPPQPSDAQVA